MKSFTLPTVSTLSVLTCLLFVVAVSGHRFDIDKYKYLDHAGTYHDVDVRINVAFVTPKIIYDSTNHKIEIITARFPPDDYVTYVKAQNIFYLDLTGWIGSFDSHKVERVDDRSVDRFYDQFISGLGLTFLISGPFILIASFKILAYSIDNIILCFINRKQQ